MDEKTAPVEVASFPSLFKVLYIPGGWLGFLASTVCQSKSYSPKWHLQFMDIRILNAFCLKQVCYARFQTKLTPTHPNIHDMLCPIALSMHSLQATCWLHVAEAIIFPRSNAKIDSLCLHWFAMSLWHHEASKELCKRLYNNSRSLSLFIKFKASSRT